VNSLVPKLICKYIQRPEIKKYIKRIKITKTTLEIEIIIPPDMKEIIDCVRKLGD